MSYIPKTTQAISLQLGIGGAGGLPAFTVPQLAEYQEPLDENTELTLLNLTNAEIDDLRALTIVNVVFFDLSEGRIVFAPVKGGGKLPPVGLPIVILDSTQDFQSMSDESLPLFVPEDVAHLTGMTEPLRWPPAEE